LDSNIHCANFLIRSSKFAIFDPSFKKNEMVKQLSATRVGFGFCYPILQPPSAFVKEFHG
jgi:hypothetical protein